MGQTYDFSKYRLIIADIYCLTVERFTVATSSGLLETSPISLCCVILAVWVDAW